MGEESTEEMVAGAPVSAASSDSETSDFPDSEPSESETSSCFVEVEAQEARDAVLYPSVGQCCVVNQGWQEELQQQEDEERMEDQQKKEEMEHQKKEEMEQQKKEEMEQKKKEELDRVEEQKKKEELERVEEHRKREDLPLQEIARLKEALRLQEEDRGLHVHGGETKTGAQESVVYPSVRQNPEAACWWEQEMLEEEREARHDEDIQAALRMGRAKKDNEKKAAEATRKGSRTRVPTPKVAARQLRAQVPQGKVTFDEYDTTYAADLGYLEESREGTPPRGWVSRDEEEEEEAMNTKYDSADLYPMETPKERRVRKAGQARNVEIMREGLAKYGKSFWTMNMDEWPGRY
jgi:hypothetical protein